MFHVERFVPRSDWAGSDEVQGDIDGVQSPVRFQAPSRAAVVRVLSPHGYADAPRDCGGKESEGEEAMRPRKWVLLCCEDEKVSSEAIAGWKAK